jgi:hypothetical protein
VVCSALFSARFWLRYFSIFNAMLQDFGGSHIIVKRLTTCAAKVGWNTTLLMSFSSRTDADFESLKLVNMAGANMEVNALAKIGQENRDEIKGLKEMVLQLVASNERMSEQVTAMSNTMAERTRNSPYKNQSPSRARPVAESPGADEAGEASQDGDSSSSSSSKTTQPNITGLYLREKSWQPQRTSQPWAHGAQHTLFNNASLSMSP